MKQRDHEQGLVYDLTTLQQTAFKRRDVMRWTLGAGLVSIVGCEGAAGLAGKAALGSHSTAASSAGADCTIIPEETAGPFPADGSNGANSGPPPGGPNGPFGAGAPWGPPPGGAPGGPPFGAGGPGGPRPGAGGAPGGPPTGGAVASADLINALALSGIVRSDIRASIAGATGVADGVPLTVQLTIVNASDRCTPLSGYAVYIWHCDRAGNYSMYSADAAAENYLRGVQATDSRGVVTFRSIYPACYMGRWPHIHFEIFPSLKRATDATSKLATSQLALPEAVNQLVYAEPGYEQSVPNLQQITLASDMVFSDGYATQVPTITGSVSAGYAIALTVGVKAI